jgi:hypothetical protein
MMMTCGYNGTSSQQMQHMGKFVTASYRDVIGMMVKGIIPTRVYYMWVNKRILYMSSRWVITSPQSYLAVPRKIRRILYRIDLFSQAFTGNSRFCFDPSSTCKEKIQEIPLAFLGGFLMKMAKSQDHGSVCIFCCVYPLRTECLSSTRIGCVSNPGLSSKLAYNDNIYIYRERGFGWQTLHCSTENDLSCIHCGQWMRNTILPLKFDRVSLVTGAVHNFAMECHLIFTMLWQVYRTICAANDCLGHFPRPVSICICRAT